MRTRRIVVAACLGTTLVWVVTATAAGLYSYTDEELGGPVQPIAFSHVVHSTNLAIDCLYCHTGAESSQHAGMPAGSICMGCHQWVKSRLNEPGPEDDVDVKLSAEEIAKVAAYQVKGQSIPWVRIHRVPEHVRFKHQRHLRPAIMCEECHGLVQTMNRVYMTPDTKLRPSSAYLPAKKLEMGWCMDCHLQRQGSEDCGACHY